MTSRAFAQPRAVPRLVRPCPNVGTLVRPVGAVRTRARLAAGAVAGFSRQHERFARSSSSWSSILIRISAPRAVRIVRSVRRPRATLLLAVAGLALVAATQPGGQPQGVALPAPDLAGAVTAASTSVTPMPEQTPTDDTDSVTFAEVEGAELVLPAADVVAHGFHEPGGGGPTPLTPVGTVIDDGDLNGFDPSEAIADADGPDYMVLPTRNRGTAPTGAVDVVVEEDEQVLAPVDGVVTAVADYRLYGNHHDTLVHVQPTAAPHLEVKVLHIEGVRVAEGDTVVAGETVIAERARRIPVANQIDRFVGRELPHVHLEVLST